jgi:hypothetical protein
MHCVWVILRGNNQTFLKLRCSYSPHSPVPLNSWVVLRLEPSLHTGRLSAFAFVRHSWQYVQD